MSEATSVDPRPRVERSDDGYWYVAGVRCRSCGRAVAYRWPRCPVCAGPIDPAVFGTTGTVWSSTVVRIPVSDRNPPYALAYVDLAEGPRVLAHVTGEPTDTPVAVGSTARVIAPSADGDLRVEVRR